MIAGAYAQESQEAVDPQEYVEPGADVPAEVDELEQDELDEVDSAEELNDVVLQTTTEEDDAADGDMEMDAEGNLQQTSPNSSTTPDMPEQEMEDADPTMMPAETQPGDMNPPEDMGEMSDDADTMSDDDMDDVDTSDEYEAEDYNTLNEGEPLEDEDYNRSELDDGTAFDPATGTYEDGPDAAVSPISQDYDTEDEGEVSTTTVAQDDEYDIPVSDDEARLADGDDMDEMDDDEMAVANVDASTESMGTDFGGEVYGYQLIDVDIFNAEGDEVADLIDVIVDENGMATDAIIESGGFAGVGEETYVVAFDKLTPVRDGEKLRFEIDADKETIAAYAPWSRDDFVIGENGNTLLSELRSAEIQLASSDETVEVEDLVMSSEGRLENVVIAYDDQRYALPYSDIAVAEGDAETNVGYSVDVSPENFGTMTPYEGTLAVPLTRRLQDGVNNTFQGNRTAAEREVQEFEAETDETLNEAEAEFDEAGNAIETEADQMGDDIERGYDEAEMEAEEFGNDVEREAAETAADAEALGNEVEYEAEELGNDVERETEELGNDIERGYDATEQEAEELGNDIERETNELGNDIEAGAETTEMEAEEFGNDVERETEELGNDIEAGAENVEQEAEELGDDIENEAEEAGDEIEEETDELADDDDEPRR
ncbi:PRC-barrel domain-containing protein [Parvularcula maris]|uniref:PRC-barrel domain-containing protein n=1 Tax=Parvularcula maris TaxID=2965077 RepID=A0A9X2L939_9PROT|nr:PRC-barrel domain-containing protein [Parvularcula maris]MCQ8185329.1 PRC-barrel domain-containing protein [Parvularcula maris]